MWGFLRSQQTHEERNVQVFIWNLPWLNPNFRGTYMSSIPLSFQFLLIASSLPFLFLSFFMCDLLLKRISQGWKWNPAFWHHKMQNWWPHGPSFSQKKKWCPAVLEELGTWLPTSCLLHSVISHWQKHLWQAKTPLCSPGNGLTTKKTTNELVFIYATHLKRHIIGIIAPLYSQVRLWVFFVSPPNHLVRVWFGCPKDSAEQKWHSWFHEFSQYVSQGVPWNVWSRFSWQVGWYRLASPLLCARSEPEHGSVGLSCSAFSDVENSSFNKLGGYTGRVLSTHLKKKHISQNGFSYLQQFRAWTRWTSTKKNIGNHPVP